MGLINFEDTGQCTLMTETQVLYYGARRTLSGRVGCAIQRGSLVIRGVHSSY